MRRALPGPARRARQHAARGRALRVRLREEVLPARRSRAPPGTRPTRRCWSSSRTRARERALRRSRCPPRSQERLDYELGVITKTGYAGYFLIVADFIAAARDRGIPVGPGRGSAAGSLVAYALGITDVCPLEFDLLFERFLNPERVSMPDIDVDFCFERRGEVIEYVRREVRPRAASGQIVTFGTMKSRAAVKDVGRVLGFTPAETDALAKLIPNGPAYSLTVNEAVKKVPEVQRAVRRRSPLPAAARLRDRARRALAPHRVHAAGVVIAPGPLDEYVPVCTRRPRAPAPAADGEDVIVTQYDMNALEKAGMLKMDFLGLTTLTVIHDAVADDRRRAPARRSTSTRCRLRRSGGRTSMLRAGPHGRRVPVRVAARDRHAARACAATASTTWSRPTRCCAPARSTPACTRSTSGASAARSRSRYPLPELEQILEPTYGVITYQEQVMRIAQVLAGISLAEADVLRKAVGKKDAELIKKELGKFVDEGGRAGLRPTKIIEELRRRSRRSAATASTSRTRSRTRSSRTRPRGSRRTTRPSSWRRCCRRQSATPTTW